MFYQFKDSENVKTTNKTFKPLMFLNKKKTPIIISNVLSNSSITFFYDFINKRINENNFKNKIMKLCSRFKTN